MKKQLPLDDAIKYCLDLTNPSSRGSTEDLSGASSGINSETLVLLQQWTASMLLSAEEFPGGRRRGDESRKKTLLDALDEAYSQP